MFFILSKIINFLIDPLTFILFALTLSAFFLPSAKWIKYIVLTGAILGGVLSTGFVANTAMVKLEHLKGKSILKKKYDAVVVLSGMVDLENSTQKKLEFGDAVDRVLAGYHQVQSGRSDRMIISGGSGNLFDQSHSEAVYLKEFIVGMGMNPEKIIVEARSRNTYENAVESKKIIRTKGFKNILLITSAFHMFRSEGCFTKVGLTVDRLPVDYRGVQDISYDILDFLPSSFNLSRSAMVIHELVGIIVYGLTGKASY